MIQDYNDYLEKIKEESSKIPEPNLLFWGLWHCDRLYAICHDRIVDYFSPENNILIQEIMNHLEVLIDKPELESKEILNRYFESLQDVDETNLDQVDYQENALYELIGVLDSLLSFCIDKVRGFEYTVTQSMINVIDSKLQEENIDILSVDGFTNAICQEEITLQFQMIDKLKIEKLNSDSKRLFRE